MKFINFLNKSKYFVLFLVLGLVIICYPALKSGFDSIMGSYNSLYYNYVAEHSYLWLKGVHGSFWGAPFNYFDPHSIAQADSLFAILPIYWLIRLFEKNPISAYQILFIILCVLNYTLFYCFLKKIKLGSLPCSLGAFIFAFSTLRYFNLDNIGTFSQFLSIIAILFLLKTNKNQKNIINHFYFLGFALFLIMQFYTCFALGFFTLFCAVFALILSLLPKISRDIVVDYLKYFYKYILFYLFVVFISLLPMAYQFSCLGYCVPLSKILSNTANFSIWFRSLSVLDNIIKFNFDYIGENSHLCAMSAGIITTFASVYGLFKTPKIKGVSLMTLIFMVLISSGYSAIYFWRIFYYYSPGIESLEGVYYIAFAGLFLISVGVGLFISKVKNKFILIPVLILIVLEQISYNNDPNSSLRNYFISKKDFISSLENLVSEDEYISVSYNTVNEKQFGKDDLIIKNRNAQKIADLHALWLGIRENKPVINNYMKKSKPKESHSAQDINIIVDYNQI